MIPLSKEVLNTEIIVAEGILKKWKDKLAAGIPAQEVPGDEAALDQFTREMIAEFLVVAGKFETLATIISEGNQ
jgi:hypothetical protein